MLAEKPKDKRHARSCIVAGSTQIQNNKLTSERFNSRCEDIETLRDVIENFNINPNSLKNPKLIKYENIISLSKKYHLGNCMELALHALDYILDQSIDGLNAETYFIDGGDHVILVLNRNSNSDPHNPATWGEDAVICDPWADNVYPARHYRMILKNYYYKCNGNYIENFDAKNHTLSPAWGFNTKFILKARDPENIKSRLFEQAEDIIHILNNYISDLRTEKQRLIDTYGLTDVKSIIIDNKIMEVEKHILKINQTIGQLINQEYDCYQQVISRLQPVKDSIYQNAISTMMFSKTDFDILTRHKGDDLITDTMKFFGIKSKTHSQLIGITETVNSNLRKLSVR